MLLFVIPSHALEVRKQGKGQGGITVAAGETVNDTLVVFGNSVTINGTVTGDLIVFARQINVQGTVQGNIVIFGQKIDVSGTVEGDVFEFGQTIQADGKVGKNLWAFASSITLGKNIQLNNDATLFSAEAYINGDVGRDATVFSGTLDVGSKLGRDLRFRGTQLMVHPSCTIGRNLYSKTHTVQGLQIDPSATIGGKKMVEFEKPKPNRYLTAGFYVRQFLRIAAAFLLGFIVCWIFPSISRISISTARTLLISGGIGFLSAVAIPVAAIILAITLIGLPIGLVAIMLWLLGLYMAKIVVARCIGAALLGKESQGLKSTALSLLIGLVIVVVAVNLPYIGGVLNFVLMLIGLGALAKTLYRAQASTIQ
jgi:cytoskeletal protein CcmA (bactofilin family)